LAGELIFTGELCHPYLPEPGLVDVVNLAILLERPLLLKGAPGSGKSSLAAAIAAEFSHRYDTDWPYEVWRVRSTSRARDGLYTYDSVARLRDAQLVANRRAAKGRHINISPERYVRYGPLGQAIINSRRAVILIDEIDRADIDFPNDLLVELDELKFQITETGQTITAQAKPLIIITSNDEKGLPAAFLRRCLFYYLDFPQSDRLFEIVNTRFPEVQAETTESYVSGKTHEITM
jgi:MoxR-like ATPase